MTLKIAVIAGDGVGPEVIAQARAIINEAAGRESLDLKFTDLPYGAAHYLKTNEVITDEQVADLKAFDAILLGAVGHPDVKPGVLEKGLLLKLRFALDLYINLRPVRLLEGVECPLKNKGPAQINFDVIRENTEDLYCGNGGIMRKDTPQEVSTQEMLATRFGVERCIRYAFELCRRKQAAGIGGKQLTLVHKINVLTHCGDTWNRTFNEVGAADYPEISRNYHHVDACCMYMATKPEIYDTIVVPNMFGDIITDLGAAIAGGMGVAASGNLNPRGESPSMYEPVHGSAPDIAGQNKANPIAAALSAAMMLKETGAIKNNSAAIKAGQRIEKAVEAICPKFAGMPMDRPTYSTTQIGQMILGAM